MRTYKPINLSNGESQKELFDRYYEHFFKLLEDYILLVLNNGDIYSSRSKIIDYLVNVYSESFLEEVAFILDELGVVIDDESVLEISSLLDASTFVIANRERINDILISYEEDINSLLSEGKTKDEIKELYKDKLVILVSSELHMGVEKASVQGAKLLEFLVGTKIYKTWNCIGDERTCPTCLAMNGVTVPVGESFIGDGMDESIVSQLSYVGGDITYAHPRCRCWVTYSSA